MDLKKFVVMVGANNAGKSSTVEALTLISLITNNYENLTYRAPPTESNLPRSMTVVAPSLKLYNFDFTSVFHDLGDAPSVIEAMFSSGEKVTVHIAADQRVYGTIQNRKGVYIRSKASAAEVRLPHIAVLPQVGPLQREEDVLNEDYVRASVGSRLAPLHFRNELTIFNSAYARFVDLAESTWSNLRVKELVNRKRGKGVIGLLIQDGTFVAEVAWMGHGMQIWLQTLWFLARTPANAIVVLDEPDVYLHPDLQTKIVRLVKSKHSQTIIATHSTEIVSDVRPSEVLVIDRLSSRSRFADDDPDVQAVLGNMGSRHNIALTRLYSNNRCVLVEGEDLDFLTPVYDRLFPNETMPLAIVPSLPLGGWGGWQRAIASRPILRRIGGAGLRVYCILDSDYHFDDEIAERYAEARANDIELHVWRRKEIENYFCVPGAIARVICERNDEANYETVLRDVEDAVGRISNELRQGVVDDVATEYSSREKKKSYKTVKRYAENIVRKKWATNEGRNELVPGKELLSSLSAWAQDKYKVSFGVITLSRAMTVNEIVPEMSNVIRSIRTGRPFSE